MKPALAATDSALLELLEQARKDWPELLCAGGTDLWERALYGPIREFLRRPGKAFRARLVEASWEAAGGTEPPPKTLPLIVELIHAGSLIVDDIQDESELRRGEPTLHRVVGTPTALNAGNWLYFWPLRLISAMDLPERIELAVLRRAGETLLRCHEGQALDLSVRVGELSQRDVGRVVETTTRLKTGSLMEFSAALGAEAAGAGPDLLGAICRFGRELGVGLQMLDDLGSLLSDGRADKALEDLSQGRPTWPWAWLAGDGDEVSFAALQQQARSLGNGRSTLDLRDAMRKSLAGQGRLRVRSHLSRSIAGLRDTIGDTPALRAIEDEIVRLEQSYG